MLILLIFIFTVVPLVELAILLRLGALLGWIPTLALVVLTGVIGVALAKQQGLKAISHIEHELDQGTVPTSSMADGALILIAGVLLIAPGVLTDLSGFALLIPPVRGWVKKRLSAAWRDRLDIHNGTIEDARANEQYFVDVEATSASADDED